ncbi:hypothetical protein WJX84_009290 [Apatococcus fuscideae]
MHRLETLRSNTDLSEDDVEAAASVLRSDAIDVEQPLLEEHDQETNGQQSGRRVLGPRESFRRAGHEVMAARRFLKRANESSASSKSAATPRTWSDRIVNIGTGLMPEVQKPDAEDVGAPSKGPGIISPMTDFRAYYQLVIGSWMNVLLLAVPLGWVAYFLHWGSMAVFLLNFAALIPLALILGEVTEDLALRFGQTIGGLLNATFGNVVEAILSIAALMKGLYTVVATSLIGSILSNLLLVLGFCFLCGGSKYKQQQFNLLANKACCSMLFMACIALSIPVSSQFMYGKEMADDTTVAHLSHGTAILLIIVYACYLLFQLKTHEDLFASDEGGEAPCLSLSGAIGGLAVITVIVAVCSEFLTGALEDVSKQSGLNQAFLGLIVLPIAGNACEHITAVFVSIKNKMDLAIGVALGSSIQIAVFVIPVTVIVGWVFNKPFFLDSFAPFPTLMLTFAVIHAYFVSSDGNSNWLMGVELVGTYTLIAMLYLFLHMS